MISPLPPSYVKLFVYTEPWRHHQWQSRFCRPPGPTWPAASSLLFMVTRRGRRHIERLFSKGDFWSYLYVFFQDLRRRISVVPLWWSHIFLIPHTSMSWYFIYVNIGTNLYNIFRLFSPFAPVLHNLTPNHITMLCFRVPVPPSKTADPKFA